MKTIYTVFFLIIYISVNGQGLDDLLKSIENNNPVLIAQQKWLESERTKSKTDIYIENPEITYNYLWGNQESTGDQKELEIVQPFRLPGYYRSRSEVKDIRYEQQVLISEKIKHEILNTARINYFNVVRLSKKVELLKNRMEESE